MIRIRRYRDPDWADTWRVLEPVFRAGDTYPYSPAITEEDAHRVWVESPTAVYVAEEETGEIVGTYYIKPNQPTLGAHVCNCGYVVAPHARGRGIASTMCSHSQREAIALGFLCMQYNLVVSTNEGAIRLWARHGFFTVGRLPNAFRHPELGLVDALLMYKELRS